jgi:hypothetical protein
LPWSMWAMMEKLRMLFIKKTRQAGGFQEIPVNECVGHATKKGIAGCPFNEINP